MKTAYHGSLKKGLTELIFSPSLARSSNLHEGEGIYLTEDREIAESYAGEEGQVYKIDISECSFFDATNKYSFLKILEKISADYHLPSLVDVPFVMETVEAVIEGDSSISSFGRSIKIILENDEKFIKKLEDNGGYKFSEDLSQDIQSEIDMFDGYKYYDRSFKNSSALIFLVKDSSKIKILD